MRSDSFHFVIWHHSEFLAKNDTAESKNQHLYIKPERRKCSCTKMPRPDCRKFSLDRGVDQPWPQDCGREFLSRSVMGGRIVR